MPLGRVICGVEEGPIVNAMTNPATASLPDAEEIEPQRIDHDREIREDAPSEGVT